MAPLSRQSGYTLVEVVVTVAIAAMLLGGLQQLLSSTMLARDSVERRTELARSARFAMTRMENAVAGSQRILIPLADNPATNFDENVRLQTVPASPPQGSSTLATAVLALTMDRFQDIDRNGIYDADNDGDGRFDEDLPADTQNDGKAGVRDFDDDGNGFKDFFFSPAGDDDESSDFAQNEDNFDGVDDDGDGSIDEDPGADINGDGAPGIAGVDDDGDGDIDEGDIDDDDEDGQVDEDWFDPVVFYLQDSSLIERRTVPWDENGDSTVDGRDFVESVLTDKVTSLRFERVPRNAGQQQLIDISLTLTGTIDESISVTTQVRLGAWQ